MIPPWHRKRKPLYRCPSPQQRWPHLMLSHWRVRERTKFPLGVSLSPVGYSEATLHHWRNARWHSKPRIECEQHPDPKDPVREPRRIGGRISRLGWAKRRQTINCLAVPWAATEVSGDWTAVWPAQETAPPWRPAKTQGPPALKKVSIHPEAILGRGRGRKLNSQILSVHMEGNDLRGRAASETGENKEC